MWWKHAWELERASLGYWLPPGQDGVGLTAGSVMSCFLEKISSKCGKMLRFDIFLSTLLYV